jgi:hypothetical protein
LHQILEATPTASTAWEAMTNEQFARIPKPSVATVDAVRATLQNQVGAFCEGLGRSETCLEFPDWRLGAFLNPVTLEARFAGRAQPTFPLPRRDLQKSRTI